jgi:uncharacterized phage infection (PIP) family protein YhgE
MLRKGSILLPILIALFVISLLAAIGVFYLFQKEHAQNINLRAQVVELEARQLLTNKQLDEARRKATDLEFRLQETKNRMDSLASELAAEKSAHSQATNQLEQLKNDIAQQKSLREDLENRLSQVQEGSQQAKEQIKIMQQQKAALEQKIKNLEAGSGGVELGTVVVNPEVGTKTSKVIKKEQPALTGTLEAKVMIVNKEFNFVVINVGSKDKVSVGDEFLVSRAGKPIGEIKVEKVHEFMSAAGFAVELKDLIKENDKVTQKAK